MSRPTYKELQQLGMESDEKAEWPRHYDCITIRNNRLYLKIAGEHHQEIDITHVYQFLKEMFTTDWKEATE